MNRTEELIATALRDIAEEARDPRPMAGLAWRAGRRRRLTGMASAAAVVAGAIAVTVALLPGHAVGSATVAGHGLAPASATRQHHQPAAAHKLRWPLELRQVTAVSDKPCTPRSSGVPGASDGSYVAPGQCFSLGQRGMTITSVRSAAVRLSTTDDEYAVVLGLNSSDASQLGKLTTYMYNVYYDNSAKSAQDQVRDEVAFIADGHVVYAPEIDGPVTTGSLTINCVSHASAEYLLAHL